MPPPPDLDRLLLMKQYPGMPAPESEICRRWLTRHGAEYDRLEFNVRLGEGTDPGEEYLERTRAQAILLTQKRADLIAWLDEQATIIEVKIRAGLGALGQLTGYGHYYTEQHPNAPPPRLLIVAERADADVVRVMAANGVDLVLYERPARAAPA